MLNLNKPIVFFDLEGTGVDPYNDRIIQIAAIKYFPNGEKKEYEWIVNPGIPIPPGSTEIHGFRDEDVKDKPMLGDLVAEVSEVFLDSDLGGYNIKYYDIPMIQNEFARIGLNLDTESVNIVDAMMIYKIKEPRTLEAAYGKYVGGMFDNAHDAMADIKASIEVLEGQINMYEDVPSSAAEIHEYCFPKEPDHFDNDGKLKFIDSKLAINFGKNRGKTLEELAFSDRGYLEWILNGNFSEKVKGAIRDVLK